MASIGFIAADLHALVRRGLRFATVLADPPWQYENRASRGAAENHYRTLSLEELRALPVRELVLDNAHCHLWTTNAFLFEAKEVLEAWGFAYKSVFVWVKPDLGCGNYWRVSHEFLLLGVRGSCPFLDHSQQSWIHQARTEHSAKPEQVRRLIERVSPEPYLELFGRHCVESWTVFGDSVERGLFDEAFVELK